MMTAATQGLDTVIGGASATNPEDALAQARQLAQDGDRVGAVEALRSASASGDERVLFQLAWLLDLCGEEDEAVRYYQECVNVDRPLVNALLNLAVIYEDRDDFANAEKYLQMVVATQPNNARARLFLRDVQASKDMYYDEAEARDLAKHNALMDTPVTDFELSVRARNCLKKMDIRTLGDLLKVSEAELLSYKNFGETSLVEIKAMLTQRGLRLGQNLETQYHRVRADVYEDLLELTDEETLNRSITTLDFSVRSRKALQLLGVQTIGDLATRTEAELMGIKNFGNTSLVEVRERLATLGLDLRTLE
ncbi:MAG: DNA-directed RNA polymerase subunit alpha C-terminal domain-containing protein [Phycisphaerales bacterium]|jgi:DNA-directed RNA polymerase subunit alpha|nr:DNA-directed RNA polymerase subunit alpha C-terminal domain-containing protein [Phycisphaerales bacterium]